MIGGYETGPTLSQGGNGGRIGVFELQADNHERGESRLLGRGGGLIEGFAEADERSAGLVIGELRSIGVGGAGPMEDHGAGWRRDGGRSGRRRGFREEDGGRGDLDEIGAHELDARKGNASTDGRRGGNEFIEREHGATRAGFGRTERRGRGDRDDFDFQRERWIGSPLGSEGAETRRFGVEGDSERGKGGAGSRRWEAVQDEPFGGVEFGGGCGTPADGGRGQNAEWMGEAGIGGEGERGKRATERAGEAGRKGGE